MAGPFRAKLPVPVPCYSHLGPPSPMIAGLRGLVSGPFRIYYEVDDAAQTIRIYRFWSTLQGDPGEDDIF